MPPNAVQYTKMKRLAPKKTLFNNKVQNEFEKTYIPSKSDNILLDNKVQYHGHTYT